MKIGMATIKYQFLYLPNFVFWLQEMKKFFNNLHRILYKPFAQKNNNTYKFDNNYDSFFHCSNIIKMKFKLYHIWKFQKLIIKI